MTQQVKMPEPVAVVRPAFDLWWAGSEPISNLVRRTNVKVGSLLITTDQMEAYKDACVREALEEAINLSSMYGATIELDAAIRALIPQHDN